MGKRHSVQSCIPQSRRRLAKGEPTSRILELRHGRSGFDTDFGGADGSGRRNVGVRDKCTGTYYERRRERSGLHTINKSSGTIHVTVAQLGSDHGFVRRGFALDRSERTSSTVRRTGRR